ncbi:hypothetical protein EON65_17680, partial [archaeon]
MDSTYLKNNILAALSEALTAMAVQIPEDPVDFLGNYLLAHVERKERYEIERKQLVDLEEKLLEKIKEDEVKEKQEAEKAEPRVHMEKMYTLFLDNVLTQASKADALQSSVNFIENTLNLPAAYAATKEVAGESEVLKYLYAGERSRQLVGKKLGKPAADDGGEDAPERQGVSFEAFKLPEVPEEEAVEETPPEEGEEGGEG